MVIRTRPPLAALWMREDYGSWSNFRPPPDTPAAGDFLLDHAPHG